MTVDASPESSKSRGAEPTSTASATPSKSGAKPTGKRKAGRPSKRASFVTERAKGRPPKAGAATKKSPRGPSAVPKSETESTKRRPGRPRKAETTVDSAETTVAKRGPGRPRKTAAAAATAAPKRGPGRPRKNAAPGTTAKRKPGRPRKITTENVGPEIAEGDVTLSAGPALNDLGRQGVAFVRALLGSAQGFAEIGGGDVLTPKEVADLVRAREKEVVAAIESGDLRAIRIGSKWRTTRQNVATWLNG